jgi:hypothetical protein
MRIITIYIAFIVYMFALSPKQITILQEVRDVAKSVPNKNGETFENTLSAICLTESSAGRDLIGDYKEKEKFALASLGVMQMRVETVRFMIKLNSKLQKFSPLTDMQIAQKLVQDVRFSALIASYYMRWLSNYRPTFFNAVSGYNGGWNNWPYYKRVMKNMELVKAHVKLGVLH